MKLYFQDVNVSSTSRLPQKRNYFKFIIHVVLDSEEPIGQKEMNFIFVFNLYDYYNHFWWSRFSDMNRCRKKGQYNTNANFRILFSWLFGNWRLYSALRRLNCLNPFLDTLSILLLLTKPIVLSVLQYIKLHLSQHSVIYYGWVSFDTDWYEPAYIFNLTSFFSIY